MGITRMTAARGRMTVTRYGTCLCLLLHTTGMMRPAVWWWWGT